MILAHPVVGRVIRVPGVRRLCQRLARNVAVYVLPYINEDKKHDFGVDLASRSMLLLVMLLNLELCASFNVVQSLIVIDGLSTQLVSTAECIMIVGGRRVIRYGHYEKLILIY